MRSSPAHAMRLLMIREIRGAAAARRRDRTHLGRGGSAMRAIWGVLAVAVMLMACTTTMDGGRPMAQASLYERLGGKPAITAVVDDFVGNVAADNRINKRFASADIP